MSHPLATLCHVPCVEGTARLACSQREVVGTMWVFGCRTCRRHAGVAPIVKTVLGKLVGRGGIVGTLVLSHALGPCSRARSGSRIPQGLRLACATACRLAVRSVAMEGPEPVGAPAPLRATARSIRMSDGGRPRVRGKRCGCLRATCFGRHSASPTPSVRRRPLSPWPSYRLGRMPLAAASWRTMGSSLTSFLSADLFFPSNGGGALCHGDWASFPSDVPLATLSPPSTQNMSLMALPHCVRKHLCLGHSDKVIGELPMSPRHRCRWGKGVSASMDFGGGGGEAGPSR